MNCEIQQFIGKFLDVKIKLERERERGGVACRKTEVDEEIIITNYYNYSTTFLTLF